MTYLLARFQNDRSGATSIEYALIASGIALVIIVSVQALGGTLNTTFTGVTNALR